MKIKTHMGVDKTLCGTPIEVGGGTSRVRLSTQETMVADDSGLVHGGFIFGLADYAAMIAVNDPHVVLGAADVRFLKPVKVGDTVEARAKVEQIQGKKQWVAVDVIQGDITVMQGMFTCFVLNQHVLKQ